MVLLGIVTALENGDQKLAQLAQCVTGVVHMRLRLVIVSRVLMIGKNNNVPSHPS
jgi:hypothetical protein